MNTIKIDQDRPENLMLLAAQRIAYERAKKMFSMQILFTVGFAILLNVIRLLPKETISLYLPYIITVSITVTILDLLFFSKYISKMKTGAAKVQEQFDCTVFKIPWNQFNSGSKPDKNFIHDNYKRFNANPKKPLENWYDIDLDGLTQEKAVLLCQETNLWYDSTLREKFKKFSFYILLGMIGLSCLISIVTKIDIGMLAFYVLAPFLPAIVLVIKIYQDNEKSINASKELQSEIVQLKRTTDNPTIDHLRQVQDKIFCSRKDSSLVPEWYYFKKRPEQEIGMKINATK